MELYDYYNLIPAEDNEYTNRSSKEYQVNEWHDSIENETFSDLTPYDPYCNEITIEGEEVTNIISDYESIEFYVLGDDDQPFWLDVAEVNGTNKWDHRRLGPYRKKREYKVVVFDAETCEKTIYTLSNKEVVPMNLEEKLRFVYHEKPKSFFDNQVLDSNDNKQEFDVSSVPDIDGCPF